MTTKYQVAVLGLGRFGQAIARELTRLGHDVLGVDSNERIVQDLADEITHVVQADVTQSEVLEELGIGHFEVVVIATSSHIEASVVATVLAKQLGARRLIAKAGNELHGTILSRVGADRVVYPEREMGVRVAHSIAAPGVRDYLDVAPGYGFARVGLGDDQAGRSLRDIDLRKTCGVSVMALHRGGSITLNPHDSEVLRSGDELIVAGRDEDLERLPGTSGSPRSHV